MNTSIYLEEEKKKQNEKKKTGPFLVFFNMIGYLCGRLGFLKV